MSTLGGPRTFAQDQAAGLGHDYVFAAGDIQVELQDRLDALALGVVPLLGDVAGTGTDTLRVRRVGGIGYAARMAELASETSLVNPSTYTGGYTEVAVALHGIAYEDTYTGQVLNDPGAGMSLDELVARFPENWLATFRYKLCVLGSGFSTVFGTSGAVWTMDDELDLLAHFSETLGASGVPVTVRDPAQVTQLREAARAETALKFESAFTEIQRVNFMQDLGDLLKLGIRTVQTNDVQQSGGDYMGFGMAPGAVGWARASTGAIRPANVGAGAMYVPAYGAFIENTGNNQQQSGWKGLSWFGLAESSSALSPRARIRSLV
jgi:hypothetical protein